MKKNYEKPEIEIVSFELDDMLMGEGDFGGTSGVPGGGQVLPIGLDDENPY